VKSNASYHSLVPRVNEGEKIYAESNSLILYGYVTQNLLKVARAIQRAMNKTLPQNRDDGGYYAIKGFLYQFDKTLIEVLDNPDTTVRFENQQDVDYEDFVLQIKHRETQEFAPNKIRKAVLQLMALFVRDPAKKLCLYCHFKDKTPQDWIPTLIDLDSLIGKNGKKRFSRQIRRQFIARFMVRFSEDYDSQFKKTLDLIRSSFSLPSIESAVIHHCIFQSRLMKLSLGPKSNRKVRFEELKGYLDDAEVRIFEVAYSKYVNEEKYVKLMKKMFFTLATPNIENFERLFLVECDPIVGLSDLIKIAAQLSKRFYRRGKSPQPFIVFRKLSGPRVAELKRMLLDGGIHFFDGTHFDGDRFRLEELAVKPLTNREYTLKVVQEENLTKVVERIHMKEVFQFYLGDPIQIDGHREHRRIQVKKTAQILRMIT